MDEWDRRLQSLGIPIPPDAWEPEAADDTIEVDNTEPEADEDMPSQD